MRLHEDQHGGTEQDDPQRREDAADHREHHLQRRLGALFLRALAALAPHLVSLDAQTIESWRESFTGLNPVQTGMQVAIPEIDGATEPFVFGGIPARGVEPAPLEDRCARIAKRIKRWNRLQTADRKELRIALVIYCFPPNKGNIGTAADLDGFPSLLDVLNELQAQGYTINVPLPAGSGDDTYRPCYNEICAPAVRRFRPQLIFVSAGFDAHFADPLASILLSARGYYEIASLIRGLADDLCEGRLVYALEGGYDLTAIAWSARACVDTLLGNAFAEDPLGGGPGVRGPDIEPLLAEVKRLHGL